MIHVSTAKQVNVSAADRGENVDGLARALLGGGEKGLPTIELLPNVDTVGFKINICLL